MLQAIRALIAVVAFCGVLAASSVSASAATTVAFSPSTNPDPATAFQCPWGVPLVATQGQTITVPSGETVLDRFSLYVTQERNSFGLPLGPVDIVYKAYVYEWDGTKVGAQVWASPLPQTLTTTVEPLEVVAETGGVAVTPGAQYILFLSVSETYEQNASNARGCLNTAEGWDPYLGGQWYFTLDGGDESLWTASETWRHGTPDVAFTAEFSSPAPPPPPTIYDFDGFYAPVNNTDAQGNYILNAVNAGQAIPVKFSLGGDHGLDVFEVDYPKSQDIACDSQAQVDGVEDTVNAGASSLSYAASSDTYTYVWKTDAAWEDSCRQLVVKFNDGTTAGANFKLK